METRTRRAVGGVLLAVVIAAGVWLSGKFARDSGVRVAELRALEGDAETARAEARKRAEALVSDDEDFATAIAEDSRRFGLAPIDLAVLRAPHVHADELDAVVELAPGRAWQSPHLSIEAFVDKVTYRQRGGTIAATHSLARVRNVGERPIAYFLRLASAERGRCVVRGTRMHNAQALRSGEVAEIVVCAGGGAIRIEDVQVLEVSELGHRYLSQVPPAAMAADAFVDAAHHPLESVERCKLDPAKTAGPIETGSATWADVADFFARHDCHRYGFPPGYRRATALIPSLPVLAPPATP